MISGNQTWTNALGQLQKQPLYLLTIPQFGIVLGSFSSSLLAPATGGIGGYGVTLYGIAGYGT